MATNNFLNFCNTDTGTNLLTQGDYSVATDRASGNKPGVASSKLVNKAIRQSAAITSQIAQMMADQKGYDVLDDGNMTTLLAQMKAMFAPKLPVVQKFTSGSGTWNRTYVFTITSGSATAGATYTNNGVTYTVSQTIASQTTLYATGSNIPSFAGTLTKASGTGDATITFQAYTFASFIQIEMIGGGGGGSGGASASAGAGGTGGNTTFGTSLLTANGGTGGTWLGSGGTGGTASLGTGPTGIANQGGQGTAGGNGGNAPGAFGAASPFGGGGGGGYVNTIGQSAISNTGAGGGGGGGAAAVAPGASGAAGGYIKAIINSPSTTYAYAVGTAGAAGTNGGSGYAGGAGGSGFIMVTEYFQ